MSDLTVPIWLLDFDGVLNAFDPAAPVLGDWDDWKTFVARGFRIRYSPKMTARILALHESGVVEVRWLTTWGRFANDELSPQLGLPEFTVAGEMPFRERGGWWKLPIAQELFSQGHSLVWTDDDIINSTPAVEWARQIAGSRRASDLRAYAAPHGALSESDMDDIEQWLVARSKEEEA